jgi:prolyl-tRNA editing enzyme YbaK/EbsC (Cys-tRNA(Pro) deacylase)/predicted Fe-S protein YdhL (DUF1289 family)
MMCGAELVSFPDGVQRVARALQAKNHPHMPVMLADAARTAQQAADALGVELGQIAKSIVFKRKADDVAVLVITSGDKRVDQVKVEALVCDGARMGRADAEFVKAKTGFSIGGVSPLAHVTPCLVLIDAELWRFETLWAAAGHPNAVFQLKPQDLQVLTHAPVVDIAQSNQKEAVDRLLKLADSVLASKGSLPSPCTSVCRMSGDTGLCEGCFRTLDEIVAWSRIDDGGEDGKRSIWSKIQQRANAALA